MRPLLLSLLLPLVLAAAEDDGAAIANFESLIHSGSYTEAMSALETYTGAHPDSWRAHYQLGYTYFRLRQLQPSVKSLCRSIVLKGDYAESHKILAYDLNILGHQDLALRELERALRYDPNSAESHYELGRILYERGSYLDAAGHLEKARQLTPDSVRVYHNLGLAYAALREDGKAVANFEEGLRRNAQQAKPSAWPLIDYATYFNLREDFARARGMLLQAIDIDSRWDQAYGELSKAYRGLGQTNEAIDALKRAVAINPNKSEYHYMLARLYTQTCQPAEARAQLAQYEQARRASITPKPE